VLHDGKKKYIDFLCDLIKGIGAQRILDIGCGFGFFLKGLDYLDYCTYGIDISKKAIEESQKRSRAGLAQANATAIPFKTSSFDAVTIFDLIEHVKDYEAGLREIHRVLKPGGYIFLITLNAGSFLRPLAGQSWSWYKDSSHEHMFSTSQIEKSLLICGFGETDVRTFLNFYVAGETTKVLRIFRPLARIIFVPKIGDSILAMARAEKKS
jgi:2-polyprenyl-3-methyl-5-hydroxy-6-metoxy-1,4-benzoquinol methylase